MTFRKLIGATAVSAVLALSPVGGIAADAISQEQKAAIGDIIKEYLLNNPQVVLDALVKAQEWQENKKMSDNADRLFRSPNVYVAGNPDGDIALVEFFDYNCGYCKRAMDDVLAYIENDSNVRVIMREFPILGEGSIVASKAAIASRKQGKYWPFHIALLRSKGLRNEAQVMAIAESVGLDVDQLKKDMEDDSVAAVIREGYELADALGIRGTPTFVLDDRIVQNSDNLQEILASATAEIRQSGGCKVC